jgi:hypothetical protein
MKTSLFLEVLGKEFETNLSSKTGWGRNEIKEQFNKAVISTLIKAGNLTEIEVDTSTVKVPDSIIQARSYKESPF